MDKFLETYNLLKVIQEESWILNRQITPTEIEAVIKKLLTNKAKSEGNYRNNEDHSRNKQNSIKKW